MHTGFWSEDVREGDHLQDPGVDGKIILKMIYNMWETCMDWTVLSEDKDMWHAVMNGVINLRVP